RGSTHHAADTRARAESNPPPSDQRGGALHRALLRRRTRAGAYDLIIAAGTILAETDELAALPNRADPPWVRPGGPQEDPALLEDDGLEGVARHHLEAAFVGGVVHQAGRDEDGDLVPALLLPRVDDGRALERDPLHAVDAARRAQPIALSPELLPHLHGENLCGALDVASGP